MSTTSIGSTRLRLGRPPSHRGRPGLAGMLVLMLATGACSEGKAPTAAAPPTVGREASPSSTGPAGPTSIGPLASNLYAATLPSAGLAPSVRDVPSRVYVPNSETATVSVIDPAPMTVVDTFPVGRLPQHITPSWDLSTLYVDNNQGNSLTPIDPRTGKPGKAIEVADPYNLYFTPDGKRAIVVAERLRRLDFRDPVTWQLVKSVDTPCRGVDHGDFSADGRTMLLSCEFTGDLLRVDVDSMSVTGRLHVGGQPIDVRLAPDGSVFFVANQSRGGVSIVDATGLQEVGFLPTGAGAHGLLLSRDTAKLYVTNRKAGSISVLDLATRHVEATWPIGGSPDMGGVSVDGTQLWVSGRYSRAVYVVDSRSGELVKSIPVGAGPHGLAVFPQPGRVSLGHTGAYR